MTLPQSTSAQTKKIPHYIKCQKIGEQEKRYACYTLSQIKILLKDYEGFNLVQGKYKLKKEQLGLTKKALAASQGRGDKLHKALASAKKVIKLKTEESARLKKAMARRRIVLALTFSITLVGTAVATGLVVWAINEATMCPSQIAQAPLYVR